MTQKIEEMESAETGSAVEQRERMRVLIAELVQANQELRFKIAQLKEKVARLEKGSAEDAPWAGMLI